MFDSTYVNNSSHNHSETTLQQVSGSLIKTNPNSIFVSFKQDSDLAQDIFSIEPKIKVGKTYIEGMLPNRGYYLTDYAPVTVLQIMLSHNDSYICEILIHYDEKED